MTPPPVTPAIIFSDRKIYKIKVGRNTITTAANIPAQSPVYFMELIMEYRPTAIGRSLSELAKIREIKYSFQILIKLKIVTVMIPGCAMGSIISQKVLVGGHPSMAAASSKALDRLLKKVMRKMVVYGILIPIYKKISRIPLLSTWFKIPILATIPNNGRTIMTTGTPMADTNPVWITLLPGNTKRARTYAAGAQIMMRRLQEMME